MGGLSHGVIRVNTEDKNSALTVQDVGHIMPGGPLAAAVGLKLLASVHHSTSCCQYGNIVCVFQL